MKKINLLPLSAQKELTLELASRQFLNFWAWIFFSLLLLSALSFFSTFQLNSQINQAEEAIAENQALLKSATNQQLQQQVVALNDEIRKIEALRARHYYWSEALVELGNFIADDAVIDVLSLDRASGKIDISGTAQDRESILKFWADMHKSKYFKNINFPLSNLERADDAPFTYTFYINPEAIIQE
ncbi:MAG: hypothetical protein A3H72_01615 [Candidatus Doudnabacteria bacterium RIFCSPLOWO2_02_FULL_48_8]|uniref:PilN domain-containing protein n=1 Tax=Candidatus Doudnabacteria bacterium RIFCSPHIGHO2_01_FULL_46_24 TaxID=1817825 RepID=A0A1F5NTM9_9BACT|nr:MAG: hypothetical protein A2720_03885 [Candidatus Doudnabacteria bacterium RIFCSPHIGHO2_01_FULL_46_24]OGE94983.1 MAG: hypothetical protein A3H72_01615 [Candidatus Doudnabacteria bacterium RIFCSPLOWO2_02_FULL_48_8]OGE95883.1 MAG: hypothetical protein A3E98_03895 [Candidatus Doudnabacteria bacterium RIFCSPHIGHO2_12_FULL_48_11]